MNTKEKLSYFTLIKRSLIGFCDEIIEQSLMMYITEYLGHKNDFANKTINGEKLDLVSSEAVEVFRKNEFPIDIELIIDFFEFLLDAKSVDNNGIIFTPKYISDYIVKSALCDVTKYSKNIKIIDPACGCGIFLISAIEYLYNKFNIPIYEIIENNIYGIDIICENVRRSKLVLDIYCIMNDSSAVPFKKNILEADCLKNDWAKMFDIHKFNYVIGNPPYLNTHDLSQKSINFIRAEFTTTQNGVVNIFYAFIEKSVMEVTKNGVVEFIIPNNMLTIKSAEKLRIYLQENKLVSSVIDFNDNMIFRPVRTYNCIIKIEKRRQNIVSYASVSKTSNIQKALNYIEFKQLNITNLDSKGWKFIDQRVRENLIKIESQKIAIKEFIRTGIATLKDDAYLVLKDEIGYYKIVNNVRFDINSEIVKSIYKIPEMKKSSNLSEIVQYIIFPYIHDGQGYKVIEENIFQEKYAQTYRYFIEIKEILKSRDKGKANLPVWYAYGRSQGLNKYGKKLLFPTFSNHPKFLPVNTEDALFCNGYGIFENNQVELAILEKVLNSIIMDYYVRNSSYSIDGGYYCYQKKYIENFSVPEFTENEKTFLLCSDNDEINDFLMKKYEVSI